MKSCKGNSFSYKVIKYKVLLVLTLLVQTGYTQEPSYLEFGLKKESLYEDKTYIGLNPNASLSFDVFDASKLKNAYHNISSLSSDSADLAINMIGNLGCSFSIPLLVADVNEGEYILSWANHNDFLSDYELRLIDTLTEEHYSLDTAGEVTIVINLPEQFNPYRFLLSAYKVDLPTPQLTVWQDCEGGEIILSISEMDEAANLRLTVNSTVDTLLMAENGNFTLPASYFQDGENSIDYTFSGFSCHASVVQGTLPFDFLQTPVIGIGDNNDQLTSSTGRAGIWYIDDYKWSDEPSSTIPLSKSGAYTLEVSNGACNLISEPLAITGKSDPNPGELSIWPNPAIETLNLEVSSSWQIKTIHMIGMEGKVFEPPYSSTGNSLRIDISALPTGNYLLKVVTPDQVISHYTLKR